MAGEVLQVRDRSGRDWCGRLGKFIYGGVRRSVLRRGRRGEFSLVQPRRGAAGQVSCVLATNVVEWQARWRALGLGLVMYGKAGGVRCVQVRNGVGLAGKEFPWTIKLKRCKW